MEERGWEDGKYLIDGFPRRSHTAHTARDLRILNDAVSTNRFIPGWNQFVLVGKLGGSWDKITQTVTVPIISHHMFHLLPDQFLEAAIAKVCLSTQS